MIYQWRDLFDEYQRLHKTDTKILVSEAYGNDSTFVKYYQSEDGSRQGSHLPFNFVLLTDLNKTSSAADFKRVIDNRLAIIPSSKKTNWVIGNHDQPRVASRFGVEKCDALLTLVMTLPGIAVTYNVSANLIDSSNESQFHNVFDFVHLIFQGEEIGMVDNRFGISFEETVDPAALNEYQSGPRDGWQWKSRDPVRTPFQWDDTDHAGFCKCNKTWLPVNDNYPSLNLARQKSAVKSTFKFYQQLSELRKDETMMRGDFKSFIQNEVLGYTRYITPQNDNIVSVPFQYNA